ncbi:hypothetical protein [Bacteroides sp. 519]|uniref:hypothetical protein n=1 Tax=Bacteroides sp. 519 TaxID=2302937 RepID=UPI0013D4C6AE|nr:hypothetical protein [Bacteroides sp. 519]NDV58402.1 hypothetical protein [Bacteroides sp. 519]
MKKIDPNIPEIPLCTNVIRLQSYLLAPDELILFDWFIVKQFSFHYKEFHYSQARIEKETRIKRSRQDMIISKFHELEFLTTEVKDNKETKGRVRYFKIDFEILADKFILSKIINSEHEIFRAFMKYMKYHAAEQKKKTKHKKEEEFSKYAGHAIYHLLNEVYDKRRVMYNEGKLTSEKPKRAKAATQLQKNKPILKKMAKLTDNYSERAIEHAFIAYTDSVFREEIKPNNFMNYFLSYDSSIESFGVFENCLNNFNLNYSYKTE